MPELEDASYIEVEAYVRYWEDATVNGVEDENGDLIPFRRGDLWCPTISLSNGRVLDWPKGMTASIHYKVCDSGRYWLLDKDKNRIFAIIDNYVPNSYLCHGSRGYGDYIIFDVGPDGLIKNYREPTDLIPEWEPVENYASDNSLSD